MLIPVSLNAEKIALFIFQPFDINSWRYFAKKCIVSSTDIPKAILKTNIVEGFKGIPVKPITPAVIINGSKFGINEIRIILNDLNKKAIKSAISKIARLSDRTRLLIRYFVPFKNKRDLPVIFTP